MAPTQTLRCASVQIAHLPFEEGALVAAHERAISKARSQKVDLLVFPEASITGYPESKAQAVDMAIGLDDSRVLALAALCGDMVAVVGLVERGADGRLYNSIVWLQRGRVLATHRKINLPTFGRLIEGEIFTAGDQTTRLILPSEWRCSGLICADFWDPGLAYLSAVSYDDILVVPFASTREGVGGGFSNEEGWPHILKNHALVYSTPIVASNWVGRFTDHMQFWGGSTIFGPAGNVVVQAGADVDFIVADIAYHDIATARRRLPTHRDLSHDILRTELATGTDLVDSAR